jgi:hypothetical protein
VPIYSRTLDLNGHRYEVYRPHPEEAHEDEPYQTVLAAIDYDYALTCSPMSSDDGLRCRFSVGPSEWGDVISSRSLEQYLVMMPGFQVDPRKQLIEVGAGLSESVVRWADLAANLTVKGPKPVVIDPANYPLMAEMVDVAIGFAPEEEHFFQVLNTLKDIQHRCAVILDPARVTLLSVNLQEAPRVYPTLKRSADVVVDCYAAATYIPVCFDKPNVTAQRQTARKKLFDLERSFLRPNGQHFAVVPAHHT